MAARWPPAKPNIGALMRRGEDVHGRWELSVDMVWRGELDYRVGRELMECEWDMVMGFEERGGGVGGYAGKRESLRVR